eukprot:1160256-Pelagomonas_calceolata.AAC.6
MDDIDQLQEGCSNVLLQENVIKYPFATACLRGEMEGKLQVDIYLSKGQSRDSKTNASPCGNSRFIS